MIRRGKRPRRKSAHQELVEEADSWVKAIAVHRQRQIAEPGVLSISRDLPMCLRCKRKKPLQGAHIMRKGGKYNSIRHHLDNVIGLCAECHIGWAHHNELEFYEWIEEIFPGRIAALRLYARFQSGRVDLKQLICVLKDIARKEGVPCGN
jgi:hypothetical protein